MKLQVNFDASIGNPLFVLFYVAACFILPFVFLLHCPCDYFAVCVLKSAFYLC